MNAIINNEIVSTSVLEGEVITAKATVPELVTEFRGYAIKSAESILHMSRVVTQAHAFNRTLFKEFCNQIGFETQSSTIRKYLEIGKKYELLSKHTNSLPSSWTTLYTLARIEMDKLTVMLADGTIDQSLSGTAANKLLGLPQKSDTVSKHVVPNGTVEGYGFRIKFDSIPDNALIITRIKSLLKELTDYGAEVEVAKGLKNALAANDDQANLAA